MNLKIDTERFLDRTLELHRQRTPGFFERYGETGAVKCREDAQYHLSYLEQSLQSKRPLIFKHYVIWAQSVLDGLDIDTKDLVVQLECMCAALVEIDGQDDVTETAADWIGLAIAELQEFPCDRESFLKKGQPHYALARTYLDALLDTNRRAASELITRAVMEGVPIIELYLHVFQACQREVGRLWQRHEISVGQEHFCTAATQLIMSQLYPQIFSGERIDKKLVATCVGGELHELGIRMVSDIFEMHGWDSLYLGANVPSESVIQSIIDNEADLIAISVTLSTHLTVAYDLIDSIRSNYQTRGIKVMVGGYPFNIDPELWRDVGADGSAADAKESVAIAQDLVA